jgi:hypothetical protein
MSTTVKTKLSLGELYALESEINGVTNPETREKVSKGIMGHPLPMVVRYHLNNLVEIVGAEKKSIDTMRDELITKLGESSDNGFSLPTFKDKLDAEGQPELNEKGEAVKILNPNFIEFNDEMNKLLVEEKEIAHYPFTIEHLDFNTDESYPVFFKLLRSKEEEVSELPAQ